MANEFQGLELECVSPQYVPYGGTYEEQPSEYRGCTVLGSNGTGMINGVDYIGQQYSYATGHIWRGFGIIVGFWIFFIGVAALGFELRKNQGGSSVLLYKNGARREKAKDVEKSPSQALDRSQGILAQSPHQSTFTWHNLDYFVSYQGTQKQLLDKVFGFVQPGSLVALMGCSGAGKTTYVVHHHHVIVESG